MHARIDAARGGARLFGNPFGCVSVNSAAWGGRRQRNIAIFRPPTRGLNRAKGENPLGRVPGANRRASFTRWKATSKRTLDGRQTSPIRKSKASTNGSAGKSKRKSAKGKKHSERS